MLIVVSILLVGAIAVFVGWPLFLASDNDLPDRQEESPFLRQKSDALAALKEAEFDHQMEKLGDSDFAALRERYRGRALAAMAALEGTAPAGDRARPRGRFDYCPGCGSKTPPVARFCGHCGSSLEVASTNTAAV